MKYFSLRFLIIFFLAIPILLNAQNKADITRKKIETKDTSSVLVAAHRGHWRYASENSMLAIQNAIDIGVDIVDPSTKSI